METILLVDIRHEPTDLDKQMYDYIIDSGFSGIVIATKKDKIKKSQLEKHISVIAKKLGVEHRENIIPFSSSEKNEVKDMWFIFQDMMNFHKEK